MTSIGNGVFAYNDNDPSVSYGGTWLSWPSTSFYDGDYHQATGTASHLDIAFTASNITVLADSSWNHARFYCSIIDMPERPWVWYNQTVGAPGGSIVFNRTLCAASGLPVGSHTLRMGMAAGDESILDLDWYILNTTSPAGTKPVWRSDFPVVPPPAGFADTTVIPTTQSSTTSATSTSSSTSTSTSPTPSIKPKSPKGTDTALGAGVGVGTLVLLCALAFLLYWFCYRKKEPKEAFLGTEEKAFGYLRGTTSSTESVNATRPPASTVAQSTITYDALTPSYNPLSPTPYGTQPVSLASYDGPEIISMDMASSPTDVAQLSPRDLKLEDPNVFLPRL